MLDDTMQNDVMLSIIRLNFIELSVILLSVEVNYEHIKILKINLEFILYP
jgi:hypothetical protein